MTSRRYSGRVYPESHTCHHGGHHDHMPWFIIKSQLHRNEFSFQMHKRNLSDKMGVMKRLKRLIKAKETENSRLDENLEDLSLSVAERRNVSQTDGKWSFFVCLFHS